MLRKLIRSDGFCVVLLILGGIVLAAALAWTVWFAVRVAMAIKAALG